MNKRFVAGAIVPLFVAILVPSLAQAQVGIGALHAVVDARAVAVNGEKSWVDGGFGKARFGSDGDWDFQPKVTEATVMWMPKFTTALSATIVGGYQDGLDNPVDLVEAFVAVKPLPHGSTQWSVRAGLFWPPVSQEHTGGAWSVGETITPSAINAWIGEEVKVVGVEGTITQQFGEHEVSATGAVFGYNDTSGTLLSFRGWALHDLKAPAFSKLPLPPLPASLVNPQAPKTKPLEELDNRAGYYVKVTWRPPLPFNLSALYYDNNGDPLVERDRQWGWDTRFWNIGTEIVLGDRTKIIAQVMDGSTAMGFPSPKLWVLTDFSSAFVLLNRQVGDGAVTARYDTFKTRNTGQRLGPADDEDGWAITTAYRRPLNDKLTLFFEGMYVTSEKDARSRAGLAPRQDQTVLQTGLRFSL